MNPILVGMTLLIIGDSHMSSPGSLISSLHEEMTKQGAEVVTYGVCGVQPGAWASAPMASCGAAHRTGKGPVQVVGARESRAWGIDELIRQHRPAAVMVVMGDTMAGYGTPTMPRAWLQNQVATLTHAIAATGTACVWVGPAWGEEPGPYGKTYARAQEVSAQLASVSAPCAYVDSLAMSKPGDWHAPDGLHYGRAAYQSWGRAIAQRLAVVKSAPVVAQRPPELKALTVRRAN